MDGASTASAVASLAILGGKLTVQAHGFFGKVKDCPKRVKNIETDLKSTTNILEQLEKAFRNPANSGLFSLEERRNDFQGTIDGVGEIFMELTDLIKKYDGLGLWKKGKWGLTALDEATDSGRLLSTQKQNLAFILQLTQSEALSSIRHEVGNIHHGVVDIRHGVGDNCDDLRVVMSQLHVLYMNGTGISDLGLEDG